MNRLHDLRFIIGIYFLVTGILLLGYAIFGRSAVSGVAPGGVNGWAGTGFLVFGAIMMVFSGKRVSE